MHTISSSKQTTDDGKFSRETKVIGMANGMQADVTIDYFGDKVDSIHAKVYLVENPRLDAEIYSRKESFLSGGGIVNFEVNFSALGALDTEQVRKYAMVITKACDLADDFKETYVK